MRKFHKFLICLILISVSVSAVTVSAAVDTERNVSLAVSYAYDEHPVPGADFHIRRIASVDSYGTFMLIPPYSGYSVSLSDIAIDEGRTLAETLAGYAAMYHLPDDFSGTTNNEGYFEIPSLHTGMYLVTGDDITRDGYTYKAEPFLIALPNKPEDEWVYDVVAKPKSDREDAPAPPHDDIDITVKKVWENDTSSVRPESVEVQLLRDDAEYDSATLNEDNNWTHTWSDLDSSYSYKVAEKNVPDGYTVSIDKDGNRYDVVNRYKTTPSSPGSGGGGGGGSSPHHKKDEDKEEEDDTPPVVTPPSPEDPDSPSDSGDHGSPDDFYNPDYPDSDIENIFPQDPDNPSSPYSDSVSDDRGKMRGRTALRRFMDSILGRNGTTGTVGYTSEGGITKLPQTGQLWWPVPVMTVTGILLFLIGIIISRKGSSKKAEESA